MSKISVIVPIYGVEKYIRRCVESLFNQTLDDIEYIFVNDCTMDDSMTILKDCICEHPEVVNKVKIVNHNRNKGFLKQGKRVHDTTAAEIVIDK